MQVKPRHTHRVRLTTFDRLKSLIFLQEVGGKARFPGVKLDALRLPTPITRFHLLVAEVLLGMTVGGFGQTTIQFATTNYVVPEDGATAFITVERWGDSNGGFTVDYATSNNTASASRDYIAQSGTLTFAPGQTNQGFTIQILEDGRVEIDEMVNLRLSNPSVGASLGTVDSSVLTILDNERPGSLDTSFTLDSRIATFLGDSSWVTVQAP